jgi:hypothetical protein
MRELCRAPTDSPDQPPETCLATAQLDDRTRRTASGALVREPGVFGVSGLQPVRLSNGRLLRDGDLPAIDDAGTLIVFASNSGQQSSGVSFPGPENGMQFYAVRRDPDSQVWSGPTWLTVESRFAVHGYLHLSPDGQKVLMDRFDDLDVTLPRSIGETGVDGIGFRVVVEPESGDFGGRPPGMRGANHHATYAPDGNVVFEPDWAVLSDEGWQRCEAVWSLSLGAVEPVRLDDGTCDEYL